MPVDQKDGYRSENPRSGGEPAIAQTLRGCWSEPVDTFITDDIPLLLTKLSLIPATADRADASRALNPCAGGASAG